MRVRVAGIASVLTGQCIFEPGIILQPQPSADSSAKG